MKYFIHVAVALTVCFSTALASAQNKVVVIPLNSSRNVTTCTAPDEVLSAGNKCWKDRNLGATQVAMSSTDALAYGDLYQWGRLGDGHQNRTSPQTGILSANDVPGHSSFITASASPYDDWRNPQNDNLWQGLGGVNNPCPQGFRLPTAAEWEIEMVSWDSYDTAGAFASPLKLVPAGYRNDGDGALGNAGSVGYYWSSTVNGSESRNLRFFSGYTNMYNINRAYGFSVRCIKD